MPEHPGCEHLIGSRDSEPPTAPIDDLQLNGKTWKT
jgi:hypothetical protein